MDSLIGAVILTTIIALIILLIYTLTRGKRMRTGRRWLSLAVLISLGAVGTYYLPDDTLIGGKLGSEFALVLALVAMLAVYGMLVIRDVLNRSLRLWTVLSVLWLVSMVAAGWLADNPVIGRPEWLVNAFTTPDALSIITLAGLGVTTIFLLGITFYAFYIALLPEVANRALFWVLNTAIVLLSVLLSISGADMWLMVGGVLLFLGMVGATYTQVSYRVFDIRSGITAAVRTLVMIAITAAVIIAVLSLTDRLSTPSQEDRRLVTIFLAIIAATLYVLAKQVIGSFANPILNDANPTIAARKFSQQVTRTVELDQLVEVATETLNKEMGVRRSGLMLVNDISSGKNRMELLVMRGTNFPDMKEKGFMSMSGPIYQRLAAEQLPLAQFDVEYSPRYQEVDETERQFFRSLQMSAYAPITMESVLIGVLLCGPKVSDAPFHPHDLDLLATMADQTGVALRNARLVADLRHLNSSMRALNNGLEDANEQLEKLDSVKTDFITIASHELRTPLAQIRGYTDIMDALNEQGMLDKDQTAGLVNNLRKAIERTEELIAAMLDVSQIDVNAMDLRFAQAAPESILRMAIEPLTDAIKQRKLTLSARGLRGLPPIQADMQRLVQAFRNVVVNAIKFTPDGGQIDITANLQPANETQGVDHILIAISDTGVGIDKENLELIFEKFYRAYDPGLHSTGTYKFMGAGPGLGLTIARGVIESHGGKIWTESSGHNMTTYPGSTFYVLLPVNPPEDAKRVAIEDHSGEGVSEPTLMRN